MIEVERGPVISSGGLSVGLPSHGHGQAKQRHGRWAVMDERMTIGLGGTGQVALTEAGAGAVSVAVRRR